MKANISSKYISYTLHLIIWSVLLLLPYLVSNSANDYKIGVIPGMFFTAAVLIHIVIFYTNAFYLYPKFYNKRYWWLYIVSSFVLLLGSFKLKFYVIGAWFPGTLKDITAARLVYAPAIAVFIISIIYRKIVDSIRFE